jgi:hypothetical protein
MKRVLLLLTALGLVASAASAVAAAPAVTETEVVKDLTETFPEVNPCTGDRGTVTVTVNAVFHITQARDGSISVEVFKQSGTFTFDSAKASEPDFTGRLSITGVFIDAERSATGTFTFKVIGEGTDGSQLRFVGTAHFTVSGTGDVAVEFEKFRCG